MPADGLIILDGATFFYTDHRGDVDAEAAEGFLYEDVRHLSRWLLFLDRKPIDVLTSRTVDYYSARIVGTHRGEGDTPPVTIRRDRFVSEGLHEDIVVQNTSGSSRAVRLELEFGADFSDVLEAQQGGPGEGRGKRRVETGARTATLYYERGGYKRGTVLSFRRRPSQLSSKRAVFALKLAPGEEWSTCVDVIPIVDGKRRLPHHRCDAFGSAEPKEGVSLEAWLATAPALVASDRALERTYEQSLIDLAALRITPDGGVRAAMPGGGLPWYMTIFGRDSLLASFQALPFQPSLAAATLETLASLQATEWDDFRDAEPGKILHELRRGTLTALGESPHSPYFGSHDSTPLFLILLDEYERWTGDTALVRRLEPNARTALDWLRGPADLDGDGYLEYRKRSHSEFGLDNQCWKDSKDSIRFADGRQAKAPIATCELQGYAYDARRRAARLAREVWGDNELGEALEVEAEDLKRRFNRDFWVKDRRHFALALDRDKQQVDSLTSNLGHLLWSGIVDDRRARATVRMLQGPDLQSGWGIRTMSTGDAAYNPLSYHNGSVWPHDTALAAEGMRRYGFRDEAATVCLALLDAAKAFDHQLPEVFAGFERDASGVPVEYADALTPQSWAAAAPLLALRTLLGLDATARGLRRHPHVPSALGKLRLHRLEVRGKKVDA